MRIILPLFSFVTLGFALLQLNSSKQDSSYDLDAMLYNPYLLVALLAVQSFLLIWRLKESNPAVKALSVAPPEIAKISIESKPMELGEIVNTDWVLEAIAGGVVAVNTAGEIIYVNQRAEKLLSKPKDYLVGRNITDIISLEDSQGSSLLQRVLDIYNEEVLQQPQQFSQVKLAINSNEYRFVELNTTAIPEVQKALVFIFRDVTADRKIINRLYRQASRDALTDLMNRSSFEQYVDQLAHETSGVVRTHILASIDLDNFKPINDTCGHAAGDEVLKQVAQIFQKTIRRSDKVARLGGDEFAIFLEGCGLDKGKEVMESILTELRNFRFTWEGKVFSVGASIGILEFTPSPKLHIKQLFADTDKACYAAKALGRNQVAVHVGTTVPEVSEQQVNDWGKLLQMAVKEDRFILFAQPITPLQAHLDSKLQQYEILLRLPFRQSLLSPGSFMSVANRLDLMVDIDRWIIRKSLTLLAGQQASLKAAGYQNRFMINLSAQSVQDARLANFVIHLLRELDIDPDSVCFEISESVAISHFVNTKRLMMTLHDCGCLLALDDFGSGFSSFSYLRDLPLTYLKIDGNFVHNLVANPVDAAMVKAVHEVGQVMKLLTIAELVEDEQTLSHLRVIGVDYAQGYFCGRPIPMDQLSFPVSVEQYSNDTNNRP